MEELRDISIHHTAQKLFNDIKNMKIYDNLFKIVQVIFGFLFNLPTLTPFVCDF